MGKKIMNRRFNKYKMAGTIVNNGDGYFDHWCLDGESNEAFEKALIKIGVNKKITVIICEEVK